jgi:hypothetical protein
MGVVPSVVAALDAHRGMKEVTKSGLIFLGCLIKGASRSTKVRCNSTELRVMEGDRG